MAYYRRRNYGSGYRRSSAASTYLRSDAPSESGAITEIYKAVRRIMFELPSHQQESLFRRYGDKYGSSAESYARKVFPNWKSGKVGMSGQTASRMTQLVPHFFTSAQKFECIKALRRRSIGKHYKNIYVTISDWRDKVRAELIEIIGVATKYEFSPQLTSMATWLADDDARQMRLLLASVDAEEAATATAYVETELQRLEAFVSTIQHTASACHKISFEWGTLTINFSIQQPVKTFATKLKEVLGMNTGDPNKNGQLSLSTNQPNHRPGALLHGLVSQLSDEEKRNLSIVAAKEQLSLDVSALKADQRHRDSLQDMANTAKLVNTLDQNSRADYDVKSDFNTASGKTEIRVQRKANQNVALIVIILGAILLFLIMRS
jgi:hypothetical protein